jgi:signal transduction histidine kinase
MLRLPGSTEAVATLLDAVLAVGSELDLDVLLPRLVRSACYLVGARYGSLGILRQDASGVVESVTDGLNPDDLGLLGVNSSLEVPVMVRGQAFGMLSLADKVGGLDFTEDDQALVQALAGAAGMAIDNARMLQETRRQQQWSEAISEMSQALLSGQDERDALGLLVSRACSAAQADLAAIALVGEDGGLVIEAATGVDPRAGAIVGTPLTEPHWLAVLESGEPLLLVSNEGETAADPSAGLLRAASGLESHGQTALVPMSVGLGHIGLLVVAWAGDEGRVAYDSAEPLKQYADQAAVTLTAASAQRDRARMEVLEDRERIARDMHDVVIQRLFATGLGLQSAARVAGHPYVQNRLAEAVDELDLAIKDIRRMIFALHQPATVPLDEEVRELALGFRAPLGFAPIVAVTGDLDAVDEEMRLDLLAVIREALSNVARHAQAGRALVDVVIDRSVVRVGVEDDGVGFTETGRRSGLGNLQERAAHHGGTMMLISPVGVLGGTRLDWEAPLGAAESDF